MGQGTFVFMVLCSIFAFWVNLHPTMWVLLVSGLSIVATVNCPLFPVIKKLISMKFADLHQNYGSTGYDVSSLGIQSPC